MDYKRMQKRKIIGLALIAAAIIIVVFVSYTNSPQREVPIVFSQKQLLSSLWESYKGQYLEQGTLRTLDKQQGNITTSEGESYTMLRALWMDDRATFDTSYQWSKDNLQHKNDHLYSWLFGARADGTYGILTDRGGQNAASDADSDIALALLFAYSKWKDPVYLGDAQALINDIWAKEVVMINGKPVLAANDLEKASPDKIIVNPSYFAPYSYKIFAKIDPGHDWLGLAANSYDIILKSSAAALGTKVGIGIPPDWIEINKQTGDMTVPSVQVTSTSTELTTNYGYDALRTPWRIALDWQWFGDPQAKKVLDSFDFFRKEWEDKGSIKAVYAHDGSIVQPYETPAAYGGVIGYFIVSDPKDAQDVYEKKLQSLYSPDTNSWINTLSYYDDNWAWFGIALYNKALPNLAADLAPQSGTTTPPASASTTQH